MKGNQHWIAMTNINKQTENIVLESNNLSEIIRILSKVVKQEEDNLYRVLLCGLSAFTAEPLHLRIFAPTSEGKTHLLVKVSDVFPPENVKMLASASPTSFKYDNGNLVIEEHGEFIPIASKLKAFEEKLGKYLEKSLFLINSRILNTVVKLFINFPYYIKV